MKPEKKENSTFRTFIDTDEAQKIAKHIISWSGSDGKFHYNRRGESKIKDCVKLYIDAERISREHIVDSLTSGSTAMANAADAAFESMIVQILVECAYTIEDLDREAKKAESVEGKDVKKVRDKAK